MKKQIASVGIKIILRPVAIRTLQGIRVYVKRSENNWDDGLFDGVVAYFRYEGWINQSDIEKIKAGGL